MDDPYCEEVMELSAVPFFSGSLSPLTFSFHSSLPRFELRKPGGGLYAVKHMPAISSYLAQLCVDAELKKRTEGEEKTEL